MKEMLYAVRCLKSNEDMILALAGQFKQFKFNSNLSNCLNCPASARIISSFDFKHRTAYNISFIYMTYGSKNLYNANQRYHERICLLHAIRFSAIIKKTKEYVMHSYKRKLLPQH